MRHVVRPEHPSDRVGTPHIRLHDYEALYLYEALIEYAAYMSDTAEKEEIALAYAEYINMCVRDEGKNMLSVYAHTEEAKEVLIRCTDAKETVEDNLHENLKLKTEKFFRDW